MALRLHNTLSGTKESFETLEPGRVRMYTCGPTVHDRIHIGNFRTFLFEDLLRRYLRYSGYAVTQAMNITDVEDKIIQKARAAGVSIQSYTAEFIRLFFADLDALGIERAECYPRATDYIPQMVRLVQRLLEVGHAYEREGSIYFRISSFPAYGKLSKVDLSRSLDGVRVDADEYDKEDPKDFVLWKAAKPGEDFWDTELGPGRPGWHVECSAMAMALLGDTFDIHAGGVDNIFPHHENEIAQSESATGKPLARYWLHAQHLVVGERKMAKSFGNFLTLGELAARGHDPLAVRFLLISAHYRTPLQFTEEALVQAAAGLARLRECASRLREVLDTGGVATAGGGGPERNGASGLGPASEPGWESLVAAAEAGFREGLDDDLNTPRALAAVFDFVKDANVLLDGRLAPEGARRLLDALLAWDRVLGVLGKMPETVTIEVPFTRTGRLEIRLVGEVPEDVQAFVVEREEARSRRDFSRSDEIRRSVLDRGFVIEDTPAGPRVKSVPLG